MNGPAQTLVVLLGSTAIMMALAGPAAADDVLGVDSNVSFTSSGVDGSAPYSNTGAATSLTLILNGFNVTETAGAITDSPGHEISVVINAGTPTVGTMEFQDSNNYSGGTTSTPALR